tara:strand:+ start:389 stop:673 length:285 start_codon:yes stop_codon:yes gene_type:complete
MKLKKRVLKHYNHNNHFPCSYMPINDRETTYYYHEKGIVGIHFIDDIDSNKVLFQFIKDSICYSVRLKEYKNERSLALMVSKFHKLIENSLNCA